MKKKKHFLIRYILKDKQVIIKTQNQSAANTYVMTKSFSIELGLFVYIRIFQGRIHELFMMFLYNVQFVHLSIEPTHISRYYLCSMFLFFELYSSTTYTQVGKLIYNIIQSMHTLIQQKRKGFFTNLMTFASKQKRKKHTEYTQCAKSDFLYV